MLFAFNAPSENTNKRVSIDVGTETKSHKGNKPAKKVFLISFVILAVLLLVFLVLINTEAYIRTATAYKLNALNGGAARLADTSALTVYVDDGFALEVTHVKEMSANQQVDLPYYAP